MGNSIIRHLTAEQMQQEAAKQQLMADAGRQASVTRRFQFFAAFDGTRNDKDNVPLSGSPYQTNVANLFNQA